MGSFSKRFGRMLLIGLGFAFLSFLDPLFSISGAVSLGLYLARKGRKYLFEYAEDVFLGVMVSFVSFWVFQKLGILEKEAFLWGLGILLIFLTVYELRVRAIEKKGIMLKPPSR